MIVKFRNKYFFYLGHKPFVEKEHEHQITKEDNAKMMIKIHVKRQNQMKKKLVIFNLEI